MHVCSLCGDTASCVDRPGTDVKVCCHCLETKINNSEAKMARLRKRLRLEAFGNIICPDKYWGSNEQEGKD